MTYYSMKEYKLMGFKKSKNPPSMYAAVLYNIETKRQRLVNFGSRLWNNYSDLTGLNMYPELIHGDKKKKENYRKRHKNDIKEGYYSAGYFSMKYLWT